MFLPLGSQQSVSEETPRYSGQLFDPQNESELQWLYESQIIVVVVVVAAEKDVVVIIVVLAVVIVVMIVDVAVFVVVVAVLVVVVVVLVLVAVVVVVDVVVGVIVDAVVIVVAVADIVVWKVEKYNFSPKIAFFAVVFFRYSFHSKKSRHTISFTMVYLHK